MSISIAVSDFFICYVILNIKPEISPEILMLQDIKFSFDISASKYIINAI